MTAPFAPPPHPALLIIIGVSICFAAALPFVRRDDWLGWVAFAVIVAADVILWGMLLWGIVHKVRERIRGGQDS